jgi:hypothetical protein
VTATLSERTKLTLRPDLEQLPPTLPGPDAGSDRVTRPYPWGASRNERAAAAMSGDMPTL